MSLDVGEITFTVKIAKGVKYLKFKTVKGKENYLVIIVIGEKEIS